MITNIAVNASNPTGWFQQKGSDKIEPSEAEKLIVRALNGHQIEYYTEVSFVGMKYSTGYYARFDFWIPTINTIIEYDGQDYHKGEEAIQRDSLKTRFCTGHKIRLVRYNKQHYYHLGVEIANLILRNEEPSYRGKQIVNHKPKNKNQKNYSKNKHKKNKKNKKDREDKRWGKYKPRQFDKEFVPLEYKKKTQEQIKKSIENRIDTSKIVLPKPAQNFPSKKSETSCKTKPSYSTRK